MLLTWDHSITLTVLDERGNNIVSLQNDTHNSFTHVHVGTRRSRYCVTGFLGAQHEVNKVRDRWQLCPTLDRNNYNQQRQRPGTGIRRHGGKKKMRAQGQEATVIPITPCVVDDSQLYLGVLEPVECRHCSAAFKNCSGKFLNVMKFCSGFACLWTPGLHEIA